MLDRSRALLLQLSPPFLPASPVGLLAEHEITPQRPANTEHGLSRRAARLPKSLKGHHDLFYSGAPAIRALQAECTKCIVSESIQFPTPMKVFADD
jgi:hypothetical protein